MVVLTYPLIGNYGVNADDFESRRVQVEGLIVREAAEAPSNWRSAQTLDAFLKAKGVVAIKSVDTRAITRALRVRGVMMGIVTTEDTPAEALEALNRAPDYAQIDFARRVTAEAPYRWGPGSEGPEPLGETRAGDEGARFRVALHDCGVKYNIIRSLAELGCDTTVYPCTASAAEVLRDAPDGVMLSPGPGDPEQYGYIVDTVRQIAGKKPIMGVCLGNQILGCAFGSRTFKLKFGHRGSNHPVRELATGRVSITSQNHGYAIDPDLLKDGMEVAHVNLNDGTVEGLRHRELPIFSIQYHPEASPGPNDSAYFFRQFVDVLEKQQG
jgi:carbamoyl-phosphate synthase small subunit